MTAESEYISRVAHMLDESMGADILHTPFTQEETEKAVKLFGLTDKLKSAGWILPDGRLLDFNKDYHRPGSEDWVEHADIRKAFSPERQAASEGSSGQKHGKEIADAITAACLAGLIRIGGSPGGFYCDIGAEPTPEQYGVLYDCQDEDWQFDRFAEHGDYVSIVGKRDIAYGDQEEFERRFVNDVKRAFA